MTIHKRVRAQKLAAAQRKAERTEKIIAFIKKALPVFLFAALFLLPSEVMAQATTTPQGMKGVGSDISKAICSLIPIFRPIGYAAAGLIAIISLVQFIAGNREGIPKAISVVIAAIVIAQAPTIIGAMSKDMETCFTQADAAT